MDVEACEFPSYFVLTVTDKCNLSCDYCYISSGKNLMGHKTLQKSISEAFSIAFDDVTFKWIGGEPLLAGKKFFETALKLEKKFSDGRNIQNIVVTNGTLLDEDWLDLFQENNFKIYLSIDGPKEIHDSTRKYADGSGSFDNTMRAVELMREREMKLRAVCVLSKINGNAVQDLYYFFRENQINFKIYPLGYGCGQEKLRLTPADLGKSFVSLFDLWYSDSSHEITITTFKKIIKNMLASPQGKSMSMHNCHRKYFRIRWDGDVFACNRQMKDNAFCIGNINEQSYPDIINSKKFLAFYKEQSEMVKCYDCTWLRVCQGGCMRNAFLYQGSISHPDYYCEGYTSLFDHIAKKLGVQTSSN
ncbi:MAG: radical SAM protein [Candidatus Altiarchaeota archaeon]